MSHRPHAYAAPATSAPDWREAVNAIDRADASGFDWEMHPGERVGALSSRRRRTGRRIAWFALLAIVGGGAGALQAGWLALPAWIEGSLASLLEQTGSTRVGARGDGTEGVDGEPAPMPRLSLLPVASEPAMPTTEPASGGPRPWSESAGTVMPASRVTSPAPEKTDTGDAAGTKETGSGAARLVRTTPDAAPPAAPAPPAWLSPLQKEAKAVGLSPDLSTALLGRLSAADFRNARIAIEKALSGTSDDRTLVWPAKRKSGQAQFKVHFVAGAEQGCRRYVVGIAKDGWLTTAPAMERCGGKRVEASAR